MREILLDTDIAELHMPLIFESHEEAISEFGRALRTMQNLGAQIVCVELFGPKWVADAAGDILMGIPANHILPLCETELPVLAGAHITAIRGTRADFNKVGDYFTATYTAGGIKYFRSFGITPGKSSADGYGETIKNLSTMKVLLESCGYKFTDIARTWFYNFELLDWYSEFNRARTAFFEKEGIFKALLPASTGIGAPNPAGAKIESGILAIKSDGSNRFWDVRELQSPLQCGAPEYGSSFSRAVEIDTEHSSRIIISGTASIEPGGATAHLGDIEKQVDLTMCVIEGILKSRGMDFSDTIRAIAYCQRPEFYAAFKNWCYKRNLGLPHCPSYSTVCRDDLLFEVELDAAKNGEKQ